MNKALDTLQPYADEVKRVGEKPEEIEYGCHVLAYLLIGSSIPESIWAEQKKAERTHTWVEVLPRSLSAGDVVRVKADAYPKGSTLYSHNGRQGVVTAIRSGVVVSYGGRGMGTRHQTDRLERQVPVPMPKHRGET